MPSKPKHPCYHGGCPNLAEAGQKYCVIHRKEHASDYDRFDRDPASKGRYNYQWRKIRARFLRTHPFCQKCRDEGRYVKATEVHHILPLGDGGTHNESNLMALCHSCHSRITLTATNEKKRRSG